MNIKVFLDHLKSSSFIVQLGLMIAIILVYLYRVTKHFDVPIATDAALVYLPYAKIILAQGFGFLLQPESTIVSPIAYLWPALFGGNIVVVKYVNLIAGILMLMLTYGIGKQLHSNVAGFVAAFLFAASPFLISRIPTALSEPPFFLFTLIWFWSLGEIFAGKKWAIIIAAIALNLSILTRGIWFYPAILFLVITVCWGLLKIVDKTITIRLALALALGLVFPILAIIKNIIFFGLPAIDAGGGGALFFGTNLMTNGFEAPLLGLTYEYGLNPDIIQRNSDHALVALQFLRERSFFGFFDWYFTKISWITLFTTLDAPIKYSVLRAVELAMAAIGFLWGIRQKNALILIMGLGVFIQIFQTAFALYNIRYSTDNLELLLIPLAALGFVLILSLEKENINKIENNKKPIFSLNLTSLRVVGLILLLTLLILINLRLTPVINLPSHVPISVLYENKNLLKIDSNLFINEIRKTTDYSVDINVPKLILPEGSMNALWEINMSILPKAGDQCDRASLNYISDLSSNIDSRAVSFKIYDNGQMHKYLLGTANSNASLFPFVPGKLVLKFNCQTDVIIKIEKISLIVPHFIKTYFKK